MFQTMDAGLQPRNGSVLKVIEVERISTLHQDVRSLADQSALLHGLLDQQYGGPAEWTAIASQGSGEHLDRPEILQLEQLIESDEFDLVLTEDLARICRRTRAYDFCELCEDHGVRLISINDHIDTASEGWRLNALFSVLHHETSNKDTSARIRRSLRNRFSQGGVVQTLPYGYIKLPGATTDADIQKDPAAGPIFEEWFRRLADGASFSQVADWLNDQGVPVGLWCRSDKWTCAMVARLTRNPLLKGVRQRNRRKSKRVNKTGRRKSIKAPAQELLHRNVPHLAFFDPTYYDRVVRQVNERNAKYRRKKTDGADPLQNRQKKRTIWPGQHIYCGICGGLFRYGGHGQNDHLLCRGAYEYRCWNSVTVDGPLASQKIVTAISREIELLPGFDETLTQNLEDELRRATSNREFQLAELQRSWTQIDRQLRNVLSFIREGNASGAVRADLARLETEQADIQAQIDDVNRRVPESLSVPELATLKQLWRDAMSRQADEPYEFGRLMHQLIDRIVVLPFRSIDGGHIVLRANFAISLSKLIDGPCLPAVNNALRRDLVVDLFDPPQRIAFRNDVLQLRGLGMPEREVARLLGITQTAVQRAAALHRKMLSIGVSDPFEQLLDAPDSGRLRRHKHPRYQFRPFDESDAA